MKILDIVWTKEYFMTLLRDNYPEDNATLIGLMPFYLEESWKYD